MLDPTQIKSPVVRARIEAIPALAAFIDAVAGEVDGAPQDFWRCETPLTTLLASGFVADLLAYELRRLRVESDYLPSGNGESDLEIFQLGALSFSIHLFLSPMQIGHPALFGLCEHKLICNLGPGPIRLEPWRQSGAEPSDVLDRNALLEPLPARLIAPGERFRLEAHRDVARYGAVDAPAAILSLTRERVTRLRWIYDANTLAPTRLEGAGSTASRIEYACALLVALGYTDAAPVIASLYDHPDHFVRWSAVRRTMDLDRALGRELVERATSDAHPHVQRAAIRSLERLRARRASHTQED